MNTMTVIRLVKRRNPTPIIGHDNEFSTQLVLFAIDWLLGVGFTNVVIPLTNVVISLIDDNVALLIPFDDVNVDDSLQLISLTEDEVTSLTYILKEINQF